MNPRPVSSRAREGATLVFVLIVSAIVMMLSLTALSLVRSRMTRVEATLARASLRDAAESGIWRAVWLLNADTNRVDAPVEPWGQLTQEAAEGLDSGAPGVYLFIEDESARLPFPLGGREALAHYLMLSAGQEPEAAAAQARAAFDWYESFTRSAVEAAEAQTATNRILLAEEELLEVSTEAPEAFSIGIRGLTVHGDGTINVNTVGHDVFVALAMAGGATRGGAESLFQRLEMSRNRGEVFLSTQPTEALKLLQGSGTMPSPEERAALNAVRPRLRVNAACFRVTAIATEGRYRAVVQAVYEPESGRFLRWVSW